MHCFLVILHVIFLSLNFFRVSRKDATIGNLNYTNNHTLHTVGETPLARAMGLVCAMGLARVMELARTLSKAGLE